MSEPAQVDEYLSVEDGPEFEHKVRGSKFLGRTLRLDREAELATRLEVVTRSHHSARHHCWAARVGAPGGVVERSDDDGEPSGTAGRPILARIRGREIHDALVVVTRYFGGTKLGTGGLARAYSAAAEGAIEAAASRVVRVDHSWIVDFRFEDLGALESVLARSGEAIRSVEREYDPNPRMIVIVRPSCAAEIAAAIVETTAGRAKVSTS